MMNVWNINVWNFVYAIIMTIYINLITVLANWWWNWENKPDFYPKSFSIHLMITAFICILPVVIEILLSRLLTD